MRARPRTIGALNAGAIHGSPRMGVMAAPQDNDPLEHQLERLRQVAQPEIYRRLSVIERCVLAVQEGKFDPRLLEEARREAHRLAGSLGVLGYTHGTDLARRLNLLLQGS